jgi:hypothetical protein
MVIAFGFDGTPAALEKSNGPLLCAGGPLI